MSAKSAKGPNLRRWSPLRLLASPLTWKLAAVALVLLLVYIVYLDALISSSFTGQKWQLPARVYARPMELYQGLALTPDELQRELDGLGYQVAAPTRPGSYRRNGSRFDLFSREFAHADGIEAARQVSLQFHRDRLAAMHALDGEVVALMRLDPMEIGAIYPAHREDRVLLQMQDVPPFLVAALLAVEDHRFYQHRGVSVASIMRAMLQNIRSGQIVQGGSTITQQLVKNYYLDRQRSFRRKFTEAIMAMLLELRYEKEEILEAYLNEVYLGQAGARAIHGFGLGSQHYFGRPLHELRVDQLALLVAVIRGPNYYDPWRHTERALQRRNRVIDALVRQQLLSEADATWAQSQPLGLAKSQRSRYEFPAYIDLAKRQLREQYSEADLVGSGLRIHTSFDPRVQHYAEQALQSGLQRLAQREGVDKGQLQGAMVVTDLATGELLALVGGRDPRYWGFNRALDARRSIGSIVKPFVYLAALESGQGYHLASMLDDSPITLLDDKEQPWSPRNFDRSSHGEVALVTALARSYNQATVRLGSQLGADSVVSIIDRAGLGRELSPLPSLFIGAAQLTPIEVAGLYQSLATGGTQVPLRAVRAVTESDRSLLRHYPFHIEQGLSVQSVYLMQRAMMHAATHGTARAGSARLGEQWRFAGKTGTSNQQRDAWFAGFTGDLLAVVWVGMDDNSAMPFTGGSAALPIWADFIARASRRSLDPQLPPDVVERWVDIKNGQRSRSGCLDALSLPFVRGVEPGAVSSCRRP